MMTRRRVIQAVFMSCILLGGCGPQEGGQAPMAVAPEPTPWDAEKVKQRLDAGEQVYLLDVRRAEELEELGAIEGYVHIPLDELKDRLAEVPKDRPLVTYCNRGHRASEAAEILRQNGFTEPIEYGGINEWKEKGYPVVHPQAPEPAATADEEQ